MKAIVTVRLKRNIHHNSHDKQLDTCPLVIGSSGMYLLCTDSTGEHHSYIESGSCIKDIEAKAKGKFGHVTRVEAFDEADVQDLLTFSMFEIAYMRGLFENRLKELPNDYMAKSIIEKLKDKYPELERIVGTTLTQKDDKK